MITTVQTKAAAPVFTSGHGHDQVILLVGSCRTNAFLNYLVRFNDSAGQPFRIHFIDPHDQHWNADGQLGDLQQNLLKCETDPRVLGILPHVTIYIHEYYGNFGMFNTDGIKTLRDFGLNPQQDICLPNFHDKFILFTEQATYDARTREAIAANGGQPSSETLEEMKQVGLAHVEKFCQVCHKSSLPDFANYFRNWWRVERLFWTGNHVSANFTLNLFRMLNAQYLRLPLTDEFWHEASKEDLFRNPHTPLTSLDVAAYGIEWKEMVHPFVLP